MRPALNVLRLITVRCKRTIVVLVFRMNNRTCARKLCVVVLRLSNRVSILNLELKCTGKAPDGVEFFTALSENGNDRTYIEIDLYIFCL